MSGIVTLVGMGCGAWDTLTIEGAEALRNADAVLGAARLLDALPDCCTSTRVAEVGADALARLLRENTWANPCVVYSGDTGFYSGARLLTPLLDASGIAYRLIPGVSSVQILSARLGRPWHDWGLYSAHSAALDAVSAVSRGKAAFFLTGTNTPSALCAQLAAAGLGNLSVTVGENLGTPQERITRTTAREAAVSEYARLSVLLAEAAPEVYPAREPGIPDADFVRGGVPMTKQEVRAAVLAKLAVRPGDTLWDVGAGTGSVSVELSRAAYRGRVYAVERDAEACTLVRRNREKFGAWNLTLTEGIAPEALKALPVPDGVFVGGSRGGLAGILETAFGRNPRARVCVAAVTLETLSGAVNALTARGLEAEVCQISVSRTRKAGNARLLTAQNPVFLITADSNALNGGAPDSIGTVTDANAPDSVDGVTDTGGGA